jgi:hypothetical protein
MDRAQRTCFAGTGNSLSSGINLGSSLLIITQKVFQCLRTAAYLMSLLLFLELALDGNPNHIAGQYGILSKFS